MSRWTKGFLTLVLLAVLALGGIGWHYSNVLRSGALEVDHSTDPYDVKVVSVGQGLVTLAADHKSKEWWSKPGIWGLAWIAPEGEVYAQVGTIVSIKGREVVRALTPVRGLLAAGQAVRFDSLAFSGDPTTAHGIAFENVTYTSPLGPMPAWFVPGKGNTWAIFTHGRTSSRREGLRILPTLVDLGLPTLLINYRNDRESPRSPDGFYHFGATEWQDLEGAVQYALDHGAANVVLVGYSMGGAITVNFLHESPLAPRVKAVVLDAPILSFKDLVDFGAERRGFPAPLTVVGEGIAGLRFNIDWGSQDYWKYAKDFKAPILLFHGGDDTLVPISTSEAMAKLRPDSITYIRVREATHVRSWNMDPKAYTEKVRAFLSAPEILKVP